MFLSSLSSSPRAVRSVYSKSSFYTESNHLIFSSFPPCPWDGGSLHYLELRIPYHSTNRWCHTSKTLLTRTPDTQTQTHAHAHTPGPFPKSKRLSSTNVALRLSLVTERAHVYIHYILRTHTDRSPTLRYTHAKSSPFHTKRNIDLHAYLRRSWTEKDLPVGPFFFFSFHFFYFSSGHAQVGSEVFL